MYPVVAFAMVLLISQTLFLLTFMHIYLFHAIISAERYVPNGECINRNFSVLQISSKQDQCHKIPCF